MRRVRAILVFVGVTLAGIVPTAACALTLDAFTDALPPNPCLPVSGAPIVFQGVVCDGAACPPDAWSSCYQNEAAQSGLGGVLFGVPRAMRVLAGSDIAVTARVRPELGVVEVTSGGPNNHLFHVRYGTSAGNPLESLALDLTGLGALAFRIPLTGSVSSTEPMDVVVQLWGGPGAGPPNADATVLVTASGDVVAPLSAFTTRFGFSFSDVWGIDVAVVDCNDESCPDEPYPARAYTIGPITIDAGPTATGARSWGTLKTRYR